MSQRNNSADLVPLISREQAENAFRKAMNLFVGRGRAYNVAQLSKGSRVPERTIECFRSYAHGHPDYRPLHLGHQLSIAAFLGAEFTSEWLGLAHQGAFDLPEDDLPPCMRIAVDSATDNAKLLHIAADNEIDESELNDAAAIGRRKIERGMQLVAAARRAAA